MNASIMRIANIGLIALILLSIMYLPSAIVLTGGKEDHGQHGSRTNTTIQNTITSSITTPTQTREQTPSLSKSYRVEINVSLSYDKAILLAYNVRNVSYPIIEWGIEYNVSIARTILRTGDYFLNLSKREASINKTTAAVHAVVAAIHYSHAPIIAYPVLSASLKQYAQQYNYSFTLVIKCIINKSIELKQILLEAKKIYVELGYTLPPDFMNKTAYIEQQINSTIKLLEENYTVYAYRQAMRTYHDLVVLYGELIKGVFAEVLGVNPKEHVSDRLLVKKVSVRELNIVLNKLPKHIREKIAEKIMNKEHVCWKEFEKTVLKVASEYREKVKEKIIGNVVGIILSIVVRASQFPNETGKAIREWRIQNQLMNTIRLREYIGDLVKNVTENYNLTGIQLLEKCLQILSERITRATGVEVDLEHIFESMIKIHITHHIHKR